MSDLDRRSAPLGKHVARHRDGGTEGETQRQRNCDL